MLVRRCCLTRPDDLVGLGGVEHMQFPRRHKPLEARIRRPLDRRHRPLPPAPATPGSRARTLPAPSNRTDTTALPALGDPGVSRNLVPDLPMAGSVLTLAAPPNGTWLSIRVDLGMRSLTDAVRRGDKWRGFAELNGGFRATSEGICAGHGVVPVGEGIASGLDPARKPRESPPNKSALYMLRSRLPDLVHQEIWAWLIVHYAIAVLISRAAEIDPDRVSYTRTLRTIRRTATGTAASP